MARNNTGIDAEIAATEAKLKSLQERKRAQDAKDRQDQAVILGEAILQEIEKSKPSDQVQTWLSGVLETLPARKRKKVENLMPSHGEVAQQGAALT